ncbi:hypothetical protein HALLA_06480 [Halostagnicola larsenii XH-48]|uniref:Uncharacterized protein n=1 Tax=Halostagnicola larsenii XH-48 TaxID=797299 RepID=W0JII0_9EURY|nr:hypothetical protein [Halostagnicola larsenii]AHF98540.1 hypothetical protein HALLA_06480 [Halostagnicola larsenii XH-48]
MPGTFEPDDDAFEGTPLTPTRLAAFVGVADIFIFSLVGYLALENPAFGPIAGLFVGLGVYHFLPVFMQPAGLEAEHEHRDASPVREYHRLAAGFGFSAAGILVFGWGMTEGDIVVGIPGALVVAALIYLVAGFALPNAGLEN